uniref:type I-E CRISPR-associated endoribonuclease Cas2 n=1 Tax=Paenirhodobacter enshiensis TaxID=1105367 RepID=UPI0035B35B14
MRRRRSAARCGPARGSRRSSFFRLRHEGGPGLRPGDAVMVRSAPNDQCIDFATAGQNRRMPEDFDGLKLIKFFSQNR